MIQDVKNEKNMFLNLRQKKLFIFLKTGFCDSIAIIGSIA